MMSFCKKSVHSFLSLTIPMNNTNNLDTNTIFQEKPSSTTKCLGLSSGGVGGGGLGLITATGDVYRTPNVLESATVKSTSPPPSSPVKKYPGGIGFLDDVGGGVNGLMSCTESLGFESSDERRADDEIDELSPAMTSYKVKWRKIAERRRRREVKKFPPPISSLNHNGQPCFFLRPVRKDGRLELTEVRIDRPEILRAYREDGRLRLHLVHNQELEDINEEPQVLQDQENKEQHQEQEEEVKEQQEDQEEEREGEEWKFPVTGEGFRRCHELSTHRHDYHHHHHHLWRQHCVTTS